MAIIKIIRYTRLADKHAAAHNAARKKHGPSKRAARMARLWRTRALKLELGLRAL